MSEERRTSREYLRAETVANVVLYAIAMTIVAGLGISRAADNLLTPGVLAAVVAVVGLVAGLTGRPVGLYEGAHAALYDGVDTNGAAPPEVDPLDSRRLRRGALVWALGLGAWAGAAGLLVAAVLQGERAPFVVAAVVMGVLGGTASVVGGVVGRAEGLAAARAAPTSPPVPLRRRAWREVALPMAVVQALVNAAFAVLLFRDYTAGNALAARPLTESIARADALIVVALLTALFGSMASRWGRVDAARGRVEADPADALADAKHPIGAQGLVYLAFGGLVAFTVAGWVMPPLPSLLRVALVRGVIAGALTFAVCGVSHVRGALNALSGAPPARRATRRRARATGVALATGQVVLLVVVAAALVRTTVVAPSALAQPEVANATNKQLAAEGDAFVARVEYDIPLPAGTGSVARVIGRVGPPTGENSYGLAAAPSHLDAVVGLAYFNPLSDEDPLTDGDQREGPVPIPDENNFPQVECFYPGNSAQVRFSTPTDMREDLKGAPPLGYATAQCSPGPQSDVHARVAEFGGPKTATEAAAALLRTGPAGADGLFRPVRGVLEGTASAWADDVDLLGGAIKIASVAVEGASAVTGRPGGQRTLANVNLHDVNVGGTRFSLQDGQMLVGGQARPIDSASARQVLASANAALAPTGCDMAVVGKTSRYPQGFVLSRKPPPVGTKKDGSLAGSMAGGLLITCDIPQNLSEPTGFNPQRMQLLIGFVYTSATATDKIGGFGLGDLVRLPPQTPPAVTPPAVSTAGVPVPEVTTGVAPLGGAATTAAPAPTTDDPGGSSVRAAFVAVAGVFGKWPVWLAALAVWLLVTQRGLRRLQHVFSELER